MKSPNLDVNTTSQLTGKRALTSAPRGKFDWRAAEDEILARLNVREEYKLMGLRTVGSPSKGRQTARAMGRPDKNPSAQINLRTGWYRDFGRGEKLNLWEFAVKYGRVAATWRQARRVFADKVGVHIPDVKEGAGRPRKSPAPPRRKSPAPTTPKEEEKKREDIYGNLIAYHKHAAGTGALDALAAKLHLHREGLDALVVGIPGPDSPREYRLDAIGDNTLWGECQVSGMHRPTLMSADRRGSGNVKQALPGRPRGIYVPQGWCKRARDTGYVFVCEGGSDTAALTSMGLAAIGIPMAGYGAFEVAHLLWYAREYLPEKVRVVCLVDNDDGAGEDGMAKVAPELADMGRRPIYTRRTPIVHPEQMPVEMPGDDPRMERAIAAGVFSGGAQSKDSREWLGWRLLAPETTDRDTRHALGREFCEAVFMSREADVRADWDWGVTHPADVKALASRESVKYPSEHENPLLIVEDTAPYKIKSGFSHSERYLSIFDEEPTPPDPMSMLPHSGPCDHRYQVVCVHRTADHRSGGFTLRCRKWTCPGCKGYYSNEWAKHLKKRFECHTPAPVAAVWRGDWADLKKRLEAVRDAKHVYVWVRTGVDRVVIFASGPFAGSLPITPADATTEVITAIAHMHCAPDCEPIRAKGLWRLPDSADSGRWKRVTDFQDITTANHVLSGLGVEVETVLTRDLPYHLHWYPAHWKPEDREQAIQLAREGFLPPGHRRGDPPPDVASLIPLSPPVPVPPPPPPKPKPTTATIPGMGP